MQRGDAGRPGAQRIVVMGVSGCGKSTLAQGICGRTGMTFVEADDFHSAQNIERMRAGIPLTDADRAPWLAALASRLEQEAPTVLACSALRRAYRDVLRAGAPELAFVHLDAPTEVIRARMAGRVGHFMTASLLDSQVATLERLQADERGVVLDAMASLGDLITRVVEELGLAASRRI